MLPLSGNTNRSPLPFTLFLLFLCTSTFAQTPGKSGVSPSVISLPGGPGAIEGLGPSFEPQLNTGTATHSVPIAVPPGVAGHTPEITLSYNGGSGNGSLGIGWSLDTPAITRQLDKGLPRYTGADEPAVTEDTFLFQGEELVPLSDGTYRCENESSFIRFRKIGSHPSGTVDAWQADLPDGGRMLFGTAPAERVSRPGANPAAFADTYAWHLSTLTDTSGNIIAYQYNPFAPESAGVLYLTRIEYARFSDTIHHRVDFSYSSSIRFPDFRPDIFSDFTAGFERRTSKLLREITITTDANIVRRYRLDYDPNPDLEPPGVDNVPLEFSLLHRVTQLDRSGSDANYLPPLRFAYSRFAAPLSAPFLPVTGGQNFLRLGAPLTEVIDINADGLPDFVSSDSTGWYACLNLGDGRFSDEIPFTATPADGSDQSVGKRLTEPGITLADLDGDGLTDLFQKSATSARILTHRNLNGFRQPSTLGPTEIIRWGPEIEFSGDLQTGEFGALDISHPSLRMLDLNFDKRTDVMRPFDLGGGAGGIEYILNLPSGWKSELVFAPDPRLPQDWSPDEARFDGQDPSVRITGLADLNGDRLEDWYTLARVGDEAWIDYWPNANGGYWAPRRSTARIQTPGVRADEFRLMDVNADGLTDLVLVRHFELSCWINRGGEHWSNPIHRADAPPYLEGQTVLRQLDVNANGTTDLFWDNSLLDPGNLPPGASPYAYFDFVGHLKPNLLVRIDNGIGLRTTLEYKSTTRDYLEALNAGHPWTTKLPFPLLVVSRVVEDVGLDLTGDEQTDPYITDITYRDGYYDSIEKEFRGFAFVQEIERGDDYDPQTTLSGPGTGTVSGPSLVTRHRFLTGTPDGMDNDDYPPGYQGPVAADEGTGTGKIAVFLTDDAGGREEEALKGMSVLVETVDPAVLSAPPSENAGFHAAARATALAALTDPSSPEASRCTPDHYVYTRTRTDWKIRRLYRPQGVINPPGRFASGEILPPIHSLVAKSVSFAFARSINTETIEANGLLHELLNGQPVDYPTRPPRRLLSESKYDDFGNRVFEADYGIVEANNTSAYDDERITHTTYALDPNALNQWLLRFPVTQRVEDEQGTFVSETRSFYDGEELVGLPLGQLGARALLKRTERVITDDPGLLPSLEDYDPDRIHRPGDPRLPAGSCIIASRTAHDIHGNPIVLMDALGNAAEVEFTPGPSAPTDAQPRPGNHGHFRIIQYDPLRHTYPIAEIAVVGDGKDPLVTRAQYDPGFGVVVESLDWNDNLTAFVYDAFARLVKIVRPGDSEETPTQHFLYRPADSHRGLVYHYSDAGDLLNNGPTPTTPPVANAVEARAREDLSDSPEYHTFNAIQYTSGNGQSLMSLTEDELPGRWVVTETARFNLRGEPSAPYLPYYRDNPLYHRPGSQGLRHDGQAVTTADRFEILADPLGRTIRALNPPESENGPRFATLTQFLPFEVRAFDPEDARPDSPHFGTPMVYLQDGLQRLREVQEITRLDDEGTAGAGLNTWSTRYRYDLNGKLIAIQDAQANLQWFRRDGLARLLFKHDPDRGTRTYRYSASSSLIAVVDAKGQETTLTYDGLNRLLTEDYHDEDLPFSANRRYDPTQPMGGDNQPDVAYFYDAGPPSVDLGNGDLAIPVNTRGALARVTDLAGETISSFDARGRLAWEVRNLPDPRNGQPTAYTTRIRYDALDRIVEVIYPDEDRVRYEYNARNLLERIHGGARAHPDGSPFLVAATDYLPSGHIAARHHGNGAITTLRYDPRLRLRRSTIARNAANPWLDYRYHFDATANLTRIEDLRTGDGDAASEQLFNTQDLSYDDQYRLAAIHYPTAPPGFGSAPTGSIDFRYDRIGNRINQNSDINQRADGRSVVDLGDMTYGGAAGSWSRLGRSDHDAGPHALSETASGEIARYDANGNLAQLGALLCEWDFRDRLVRIENDQFRADYTYDHMNCRVVRKTFLKDSPDGAAPGSCTLHVSRYFEVRDHDQPVKYVWHAHQRIARITGTVDDSALRLQRRRIHQSWNLIHCAVSATDGVAQLGLGTDPAIAAVLRWDLSQAHYQILAPTDNLTAGDVLWVYSTDDRVLKLRGRYDEPPATDLPAAGSFLGALGLQYRPVPVADLPATSAFWIYQDSEGWVAMNPTTSAPPADGWALAPGTVGWLRLPDALPMPPPEPGLQVHYYHQDPLDSVNLVSDGAGNRVEEIVYHPFGHPRARSTATASQTTLPVHYQFGGKEQDAESGLTFFEARYLAAHLGRFTGVDPLAEDWPTDALQNPQALNTYSYCYNNPLKYRDPDGRRGVLALAAQGMARAARGAKASLARARSTTPRPATTLRTPTRTAASPSTVPAASSTDKAIARVLKMVRVARLPEGERFAFWSGQNRQVPYRMNPETGKSDRRMASKNMETAASSDFTSLENTYLGKLVLNDPIMQPGAASWEQQLPVWEAVSRKLAESASGAVEAWVSGASDQSVWNRIELPALMNNPRITSIIIRDASNPDSRQVITKD
jgi:RHS repeat-associated protein